MDSPNNLPPAEALQPRADDSAPQTAARPAASPAKTARRRSYRPSHKATFIGLAVVILILSINAVVLVFILRNKSDDDSVSRNQVTISSSVLDSIGVNTAPIGSSGTQLTVGPDAEFKGKITVAGDAAISGPLKLNGLVAGTNASFTEFSAGETSLKQLSVNGAGTFRGDLVVTGRTQLQGAVLVNQAMSVNNHLNVAGNLTIGGAFFSKTIRADNLVASSVLGVAGHIITSGSTPSVSKGSAVGSNGTVANSGNDTAGTISINIGTGATGGTLAHLTFRNSYSNIPKIVITPVGVGGNFYITNVTNSGFSVAVGSGLPTGGYRINYIAMQ